MELAGSRRTKPNVSSGRRMVGPTATRSWSQTPRGRSLSRNGSVSFAACNIRNNAVRKKRRGAVVTAAMPDAGDVHVDRDAEKRLRIFSEQLVMLAPLPIFQIDKTSSTTTHHRPNRVTRGRRRNGKTSTFYFLLFPF